MTNTTQGHKEMFACLLSRENDVEVTRYNVSSKYANDKNNVKSGWEFLLSI